MRQARLINNSDKGAMFPEKKGNDGDATFTVPQWRSKKTVKRRLAFWAVAQQLLD